jgi:hypothetical protein
MTLYEVFADPVGKSSGPKGEYGIEPILRSSCSLLNKHNKAANWPIAMTPTKTKPPPATQFRKGQMAQIQACAPF